MDANARHVLERSRLGADVERAGVERRKLILKAKFESGSSYILLQALEPSAVNPGSTCTALPVMAATWMKCASSVRSAV